MAFHVWKKALGCTTFQPHWKAFFNPKAPLLAQKNDALRLMKILRKVRPDVVHTHTARAGLVGRLAATLAGTPTLVHTYHGHVLHGYFPVWKNRLLKQMETGLGRLSDRVIAISPAVRDDLLRYGVASPSKIEVVPLVWTWHRSRRLTRMPAHFAESSG